VDANTTVREVGRTGHDPNQPIGLAGDGPETPIRPVGTRAGSPLRAGRPGRGAAKEGPFFSGEPGHLLQRDATDGEASDPAATTVGCWCRGG
jgi:hypothetical protein